VDYRGLRCGEDSPAVSFIETALAAHV